MKDVNNLYIGIREPRRKELVYDHFQIMKKLLNVSSPVQMKYIYGQFYGSLSLNYI